ncbi:MAG: glycoside hydrolase family 3 C-terminal domain-containing protein [Bacteroidales bacterium]
MITEADIEHSIRGTLRVLLKLRLLDAEGSTGSPYAGIGITDTVKPWEKPENHLLVREATARSVVLLKNENETLPLNLQKIKTIAVIGPSADLVVPDWYAGTPPYLVSAFDGIRNAAGEEVTVLFAASNKADSAVIAARQADVAVVCG